jgi:hypothetical protein
VGVRASRHAASWFGIRGLMLQGGAIGWCGTGACDAASHLRISSSAAASSSAATGSTRAFFLGSAAAPASACAAVAAVALAPVWLSARRASAGDSSSTTTRVNCWLLTMPQMSDRGSNLDGAQPRR